MRYKPSDFYCNVPQSYILHLPGVHRDGCRSQQAKAISLTRHDSLEGVWICEAAAALSVWTFNILKGQPLIPFSYHTPPHTTLLCIKQNLGVKPMQMAIIWWLTVLCIYNSQGKLSLPLFHDDWMNYPFVFLSLSSSCSSSLSSFGLHLATHVRKSCVEKRLRADHKKMKTGDTQATLCRLTCCADESKSLRQHFKWAWRRAGQTDLSLQDADSFLYDGYGNQRKSLNHMHDILQPKQFLI